MKNIIITAIYGENTEIEVVTASSDVNFAGAVATGINAIAERIGDEIDTPFDVTWVITSSDV